MKKVLRAIVFLLLAAAVFHFGDGITKKTSQLADNIASSPKIEEIKKDILTSGPLRGSLDAPASSKLTVSGTIYWTNINRRQNGNLPALKENAKLNAAAQAKVKDMFARQYFEHESPTGEGPSDLAEDANYEFIAIGENLALGNFKDDQALVEAWMNSPGHRANILNNKYTEIGVAVGKGMYEGRQTWLAVQEFGKPSSACPVVDTNLKIQIDAGKFEIDNLELEIQTKKMELESSEPRGRGEHEEYNQKVSEYNSLVKLYNNKLDILKQQIATYNFQVSSYNNCVGE